MIKSFILNVLLLLFFISKTSAQNITELYRLRSSISDNKEWIDATNRIAYELRLIAPDSTLAEAAASLKKAQADNYIKGECMALLCNNYAYAAKAKYSLAYDNAQKAMALAEKLNNDSLKGYCHLAYSVYWYNTSNYDKGVEASLTSIRIFETAGMKEGTIKSKNILAQIYQLKNDLPRAEKLLTENLGKFTDIKDPKLKAVTLHTLANVCGMQEQYDKALELDRQGLELCKSTEGMNYFASQFYDNMANCYMYSGRFPEAKKYFFQSLVIDSALGNAKQMSDTYLNLGNLSLMQKDYTGAKNNLLHCINLAQQSGYRQAIYQAWQLLSDVYKQTGDADAAMNALTKSHKVKDSIINQTSESKIAELETVYQTEKKEQQLQLQQAAITKKNFLLTGLLIAVGLITFAGFMFYRKKQVQNKLQLQTTVMEQQNLATKAVITAEENERKRIAADLHDGVGQIMSAAKMNLSAFEGEVDFKNENQKTAFEKIILLVDESCKEVRNVSHQMMPNALLKSGLANAVREFIDKIDARVLKVNLHTEGLNERIDSNTETVLYRVIQECVNNVIKHSGATALDISLIKDSDGIAATIEDNGKGFVITNKENEEGIGLKNIRSRISFLKGTVDFDSSPGNGTLVAIHVPLV